MEEYSAASDLSPTSLYSDVHGQTWSPPLYLSYKVNVDGATFSELGAFGIGVIVRDVYRQVCSGVKEQTHGSFGGN